MFLDKIFMFLQENCIDSPLSQLLIEQPVLCAVPNKSAGAEAYRKLADELIKVNS